MNVINTKIPEVLIFEPRVFEDERGWFLESFNQQTFADIYHQQFDMDMPDFVQDNHSLSKEGVLRGLHYQLPPFAQGKLVRVVQGRAWDVAVDIRQHSPTFGQWVGFDLSADNHRQLWIPAGFAHGFLALENDTQFLYKTTSYYDRDSERTILWNDEILAIEWPKGSLKIEITEKDCDGATFEQAIVRGDVF